MFTPKYDFEWNMLGIYNYNRPGKLDGYFDNLERSLEKEGDLIEAGVFRASSLLSVGLFLREKGSAKKVYGFDSFAGFPPVEHPNDSLDRYKELLESGSITQNHFDQVGRSIELRNRFSRKKQETGASGVSSSGDFSDTSKDQIMAKLDHLGLDNVVLVDGPFEETMVDGSGPETILGGIIDCDLYASYMTTFGYVW